MSTYTVLNVSYSVLVFRGRIMCCCLMVCLHLADPPVFLRVARRQDSLRQLGGREAPHQATPPPASSTRQRDQVGHHGVITVTVTVMSVPSADHCKWAERACLTTFWEMGRMLCMVSAVRINNAEIRPFGSCNEARCLAITKCLDTPVREKTLLLTTKLCGS